MVNASPPPERRATPDPRLVERVSHSMFWNTLLLPLIAVCNALTSIIIRRGFGLQSAAYDILLGLLNTILFYSSFGIPTSLTKFLPEQEAVGGRGAVVSFLRQATVVRLGFALLAVVPLNLAADSVAQWLLLGEHGVLYVRLLSLLLIARTLLELMLQTLHSFLRQLSVNLLTLAQAAGEPTLIGLSLLTGYGIAGVVGALVVSGAILSAVATVLVVQLLRNLPKLARRADPQRSVTTTYPLRDREFWRFSLFTYLYELSLYFGGPDFCRTVLGATIGDPAEVAVFSVGYYFALMVIVILVSGFRGVYRPMFARLRVDGDVGQLQRAFSAVTKVQVLLLLPAAVGLEIMAAEYVPLLYGSAFVSAVPVARLLVAFLFTETAFNLGIIILSVDQRYRPVLAAQGLLLVCAPLFLLVAAKAGLLAGLVVLGSARVGAVSIGYAVSRRLYGVRFPWGFAVRVSLVCVAMALALAAGRALSEPSLLQAAALTLVGFAVFVVGARLAGILGPEEIGLLERSRIPGQRWLLRWLAPAH